MTKQILFTKRGYEEKQKEYEALLAARPDAVKELAKAREMGDLSENGYYKAARFKLSDIDRHIRQLKHLLKIAKVQEAAAQGFIDIGSIVTIHDGKNEKTYEIVGTYESNPSEGKISYVSPLGKILMGKRRGETAVLQIADKQTVFTIQTIL